MKWNTQSFRVSINIHVDIIPLLPSVLALLDQSILRIQPSLIPPPPPQSPCVLVPKISYWWCIKSVQNLARSSDWLTYKRSQRSNYANIKGSWIFQGTLIPLKNIHFPRSSFISAGTNCAAAQNAEAHTNNNQWGETDIQTNLHLEPHDY